jgi:GNAT superfamily N-acetyltransferase
MTDEFTYQFVHRENTSLIDCIADWYLQEWKIAKEKTIEKLSQFAPNGLEFQVVLLHDSVPVATAGLYHHVGLLDREPRFKIHKHWLALVYTLPEKRGKDLGTLICIHVEQQAKELAIKEIHLFTDTAESLYRRLDWQVEERLELGSRAIVVMKKDIY